jgi:anti-anti-sigma factor
MDFVSALSLDAPNAHLVAKGELDAFAAVRLWHRLDEAIDRGCLCFTVDASAIAFVDAGGLGMFVRLRNAVAPFGGTVTVVAASPRLRQVAELAGLGGSLGLELLADASFDPKEPSLAAVGKHGARGASRPLFVVQPRSGRATEPRSYPARRGTAGEAL